MNYRHGFHAGNFADVLKHAVLCRILLHLRQKPTAFRVIDTHAGSGVYDLGGDEASRGGEWQGGIGRLVDAPRGGSADALLAPYLDTVAAFNTAGMLTTYPGSPAIVRHWLRQQDRLVACELEPRAAAALHETLRRDKRSKALELDGWTALTAYVPPKERRGLVLIDPPYEQPDEFARLAGRVAVAQRKWPTGIYMLWYPIKSRHQSDALARGVASGTAGALRAELSIGPARAGTALAAAGLLVLNPPWTLRDELAEMLPRLVAVLAPGQGDFRLERIESVGA